MNLIVAGNRIINPAHIAYVERDVNGHVTVHMVLPTFTGGWVPPGGSLPTDHERIDVSPAQGAEHVWNSLVALSKSATAA